MFVSAEDGANVEGAFAGGELAQSCGRHHL